MRLGRIQNGSVVEIDPTKMVPVGQYQITFKALVEDWTAQQRATQDIYEITPEATPSGKQPVAPTGLTGTGPFTEKWSFQDIPPPPGPTPEQVRYTTLQADTNRQDLVSRLQTSTPAQIQSYLDANVTNVAGAKAVLYRILLVLAALSIR